jgi:hypothetical protein
LRHGNAKRAGFSEDRNQYAESWLISFLIKQPDQPIPVQRTVGRIAAWV